MSGRLCLVTKIKQVDGFSIPKPTNSKQYINVLRFIY